VLVTACGGEDADLGQQPGACADCGTALLTVTDAPGDFQSYAIDLTSLELVKAHGAVVETLPATTRIDFAGLVDLGEVLSARQIPAGVYVSATLRVDYSNAEIIVEDEVGGSLAVEPVDAAGDPLGEVELSVRLDQRNRLVITPRRISHLSFDLNLEASNTVDLAASTVTVSPFVVASVVPPGERDWRVRGRLLEVDTTAATYTVQVRPFHHHQHSTGELVVNTTPDTAFEINGVAYAGASGLAQLATLDDGTMVIAFGSLDTIDYSFTAQRVLAGDSADVPERDRLAGTVLSRSGDTLVIGGVRLHWHGDGDEHRRHGRYLLQPVTLQVGPGTVVTRSAQGSGVLASGVISVGQRIQVIGDVSRVDDQTLVMDATEGLVRLVYTRIAGQVSATAVGSLVLDLASIHGIGPGRFDFTGTGLTAGQDADPDNYEVNVLGTGLNPAALAVGSWTRLYGFVSAFGTAPPDFNAATLVDLAPVRSSVGVLWVPFGTTMPFSAITATGLTLNPTATPMPLGAIRGGGPPINVATLPVALTLAPAGGEADMTYAIAHRSSHTIDTFSDFGEFAAALEATLDGQTPVYKLQAYGSYDALAVSFQARQLLVVAGD
jgi:hypothetical protein